MYGLGLQEILVLIIMAVIMGTFYWLGKRHSRKYPQDMPMTWFIFYTYVRMPYGLLMLIGGAVNADVPIYQTVSLIYSLFIIAVFLGLAFRKIWGWYLNLVLLLSDAVFFSFQFFQGEASYLIILLLVFVGIWLFPNYLYFKKRMHWFT